MRHNRWKVRMFSVGALAVAIALAFGAGPGAATVIEQHHFSDTQSFTDDDCGFTMEVQSESSGQLLLRVDTGGELFLKERTFSYSDVFTNPETGGWFVVRGKGLYHDLAATHVGGTLYEAVAIEAGQPFVIEDSAGSVILRDRGVVRETYLFDTFGDSMPSGEVVAVTDVVIRGPHPGFYEDFCEIAAELTGA